MAAYAPTAPRAMRAAFLASDIFGVLVAWVKSWRIGLLTSGCASKVMWAFYLGLDIYCESEQGEFKIYYIVPVLSSHVCRLRRPVH